MGGLFTEFTLESALLKLILALSKACWASLGQSPWTQAEEGKGTLFSQLPGEASPGQLSESRPLPTFMWDHKPHFLLSKH